MRFVAKKKQTKKKRSIPYLVFYCLIIFVDSI